MDRFGIDFMTNFVDGFCEGAPEGYDLIDAESPRPWCAPWTWEEESSWRDDSLTPYEMGKAWALKGYDDLEAVLREEAEAREED